MHELGSNSGILLAPVSASAEIYNLVLTHDSVTENYADISIHREAEGCGVAKVSETESVTPITVDASPAILLAEDDPVTRMLMTRFLKNAGYEVDAVANGSEALDKMTKRYYPMLVTDWEMPEMDGIALCKAVRNMQLDGYVYALLLTARDAKEHIIAGLEAGADDYLVKPVHEAELIARLNAGRRISRWNTRCVWRTSATAFSPSPTL